MAKSKQKAVKTPKKRSTKYGKLATVCAKELSAKKAALVRAEKALAKAQKTHTELLSEVARLDMLDRSLKALINGTEAPQSVRYVYNYPQWVWQGNPYGWYWNGNGYTLQNSPTPNWNYTTCGSLQTGQNAQFVNTINTVAGDAPTITTTAGTSNMTCNSGSSSLIGYNSSGISLDGSSGVFQNNVSLSSSIPSTSAFTVSNGPSGTADFTVDLSTGAAEEPAAEVKDEDEVAV